MHVIGLKCTRNQSCFMWSSTILRPKCKLKILSQTKIGLLIKDIVFSLFGQKLNEIKKEKICLDNRLELRHRVHRSKSWNYDWNRYIKRQEQYLTRTSSFVRSNCKGGLTSNSFIPYEPICHIKLSFLPR